MNNRIIIIWLIVLSLVFIVVSHKFKESVQEKMQKPLLVLHKTTIDYWSISHLLLFMAFGILEPNNHFKFFMLGVGFEVFEDCLSSDESSQLFECKDPEVKDSFFGSIFCNGIQDDFWYGKFDDIWVNLIGYTIGSSLRTSGFIKF
jgi:hypothetical protein